MKINDQFISTSGMLCFNTLGGYSAQITDTYTASHPIPVPHGFVLAESEVLFLGKIALGRNWVAGCWTDQGRFLNYHGNPHFDFIVDNAKIEYYPTGILQRDDYECQPIIKLSPWMNHILNEKRQNDPLWASGSLLVVSQDKENWSYGIYQSYNRADQSFVCNTVDNRVNTWQYALKFK